LAEFDADPGGSCAREETARFVHGHQLRHGLLQPQREGGQVALGVGLETAQPRRLHVEIEIIAHGQRSGCTACAATPCMPRTSLPRISASFASRSRSAAATSRSILITSFMVVMVWSATWARTSMFRASPPRLRAAEVAASWAPLDARIVICRAASSSL